MERLLASQPRTIQFTITSKVEECRKSSTKDFDPSSFDVISEELRGPSQPEICLPEIPDLPRPMKRARHDVKVEDITFICDEPRVNNIKRKDADPQQQRLDFLERVLTERSQEILELKRQLECSDKKLKEMTTRNAEQKLILVLFKEGLHSKLRAEKPFGHDKDLVLENDHTLS